jgi:tRNA-modifying protein YgfZ
VSEAGHAAAPLAVALERCGVADRSDLTRLVATGPDILDLVHRLSTGDVASLALGEGRPTVLTSPKGRIVERLTVHQLGPEGVWILAGPGAAQTVLAHLKKYTFAEQIGLADITADTAAFAVVGPSWADAAKAAGLPAVPPYGASTWPFDGGVVQVFGSDGYGPDGVLAVGNLAHAAPLRALLVEAVRSVDGAELDAFDLEAWRVLRGRPSRGAELDEEHNPLEAGLRDAVSFTKGCYVGQEVVARLNTYDKVSRRLVRLELAPGANAPARGASVRRGGREVGTVTSSVHHPALDTAIALAYVKSREVPLGTTDVTIDDGTDAGIGASLRE